MGSQIELVDNNRLQVAGNLSVNTVGQLQAEGFAALKKVPDGLVVDLVGAEVVGSATLALLISWQREALKLGKSFRIENAPSHLLEMASVSGVREILSFDV